MASARTWWKGLLSALLVRNDVPSAGDIITLADGTMIVADGVTSFAQLARALRLPAESGSAALLFPDGTGRSPATVTPEGIMKIYRPWFPDGLLQANMLSTTVQQGLSTGLATESGWAVRLGQDSAAGRGGFGTLTDGQFYAAKTPRIPFDYTRTTLDTTSYIVVGAFDATTGKHKLRSVRKSDGLTKTLVSTSYNLIDPRLSADGTSVVFRTDAPFSPIKLDRPNNNLPLGVPAKLPAWRSASVPIDGSSSTMTPIESVLLGLMLGDSLSNGTGSTVGGGYGPPLETLAGIPCFNMGIGGQTSPQIARRYNSPAATVTVTGSTIPVSGAVVLTAIDQTILLNSADLGLSLTGTLNGVHGTLSYTGGSGNAVSGYSFTADPGLLSSPASCPAGSSFVTDLGEQYKDCLLISWMGRNNGGTTQAVTDTQNAVAHMSATVKRFIVMTVINGLNEPGASSAIVQTLNPALIAAFPNNYIDIRKGLVGGSNGLTAQALWTGGPSLPSGMAYNGLTLTTGTISDTTDVTSDTVPTSLRAPSDVVHLNDYGYGYIAYVLNQYMLWKGWL